MSTQAPIPAEHWSSRIAFMLAAVGAAVGLGNVWKFPYVAGTSGGAAFVAIYLLALLAVAAPVFVSEVLIGRRGGASPPRNFRRLAAEAGRRQAWAFYGWFGIAGCFLVLSFYSVIAGWSFSYIFRTASGAFSNASPEEVAGIFQHLQSDIPTLVLWHSLFMAATAFIVSRGVQDGLERAVKIMTPALFAILLAMLIYAMTTGHFLEGARYLLSPDLDELSPSVVLAAVGQAFFTLGVGIGGLMVYGTFMGYEINLARATGVVVLADTTVAFMAGLAIFPIVFANGLDPGEGPGLVFVTLPIAFGQLPAGEVMGTIFFVLLSFAALTSSIGMIIPAVFWLQEKGWSRRRSASVAALIAWSLGFLTILSFNEWSTFYPLAILPFFEQATAFNLVDFFTSNIVLLVNGTAYAVFAGWVLGRDATIQELGVGDSGLYRSWRFCARYIVPVGVGTVFIFNLV